MRILDAIWGQIILQDWYYRLPEPLRDRSTFLLVVGVILGLPLVALLWRLAGRLRAGSLRGGDRAELARLRKAKDWLALGRRLEHLGRNGGALDAYVEGGLHSERADLLWRLDRPTEAKQAARDGEDWDLYARICEKDDDPREAAAAFERLGKPGEAARVWQGAGETRQAARCLIQAGLHANAVALIGSGDAPEDVELLESALRASLVEARGSAMSPEMAAAVRRAAQLLLASGEAERAFRLAVDSGQWTTAAPIARDYLEPRPEMLEICEKAEDLLAAAEIAAKLGDAKREARYRAEHAQHRRPAEAAQWFEKAEQPAAAAEQWAAAGKPQRAAELYAQAEEFDLAARLYGELGDTEKEQEMESVRRSRDPQSIFAAREPAQSADGQATAVTAPARGRRPAVAEAPATSHGSPSSLPAPDERYVKRDELGRGAMGVVYRAFDTVLHRDVALKVLVGGIELGAQDARMLLDEARAVARLSHPNIVQVFDAGHDREGYFVVMELIDGVNLSDMLKASRPTISGAVRLGGQILAALGHAHARRLIHRDLKPSNLLWTSDKQIKLTDFGLARVLAEKGDILTRPAGTPCYMAPEQIRGENVDARSDLYSFGCVLYEMLAGRPPFSGGGSLYHHLNSTPADPRQDRADIPEALARLVLDTLAKDPAKRPASAEQLLERLRQAA